MADKSIQWIYNTLKRAGLTTAGALGVMGNWDCESNLEANRVQGDFSPFRSVSKDYTTRVMNGSISRDTFCKDAKGYGLAQWTYHTRKAGLYDYWEAAGTDLDDAEMQTNYALNELARDYPALLNLLKTSNDIYECTKEVCRVFERPAVNNYDARFASAQKLKERLDLDAVPDSQQGEKPIPTWAATPATEWWPPRMLCKGMIGKDVIVLQAILSAREWGVDGTDGIFSSLIEEKVKDFQKANGLAVDGIVGWKTWGKLLERG